MQLNKLIRNGKCRVKYIKEYNFTWSDEELLSNIYTLDCRCLQLTELLDMSNITIYQSSLIN